MDSIGALVTAVECYLHQRAGMSLVRRQMNSVVLITVVRRPVSRSAIIVIAATNLSAG